jgi:hypothetical protein
MDKEAAKRRLHELVSGNPDRVRIMRSEREIEALNMDKVVAGGALNIFDNYDEAMFAFISKCLAEGKEVAIQAAGPTKLIVHAAHGLWRVRPGSPAPGRGTQSIQTEPKKAGGCFIATAACGDPFAPEVIALSAFRDDVLSASGIGRAFIRLYYSFSPPIAVVIAQSSTFQKVVMTAVVRPAVQAVQIVRRLRRMSLRHDRSCG